MGPSAARGVAVPTWTVRARILTSILLVTAVGMTVAGVTAFLVQRDRTMSAIDDRLTSHVESARFVVTGESRGGEGGDETVAASSPAVSYESTRDALEGVLARVIPGPNESSLGIIDGQATFVPGVAMAFHLEDDPGFISRVVDEVSDGSVRLGTAISPLGQLRYIATPVRIGDGAVGVYVTAIELRAELSELTASFTTYAAVASISLLVIGLVGWFVAGRLLRPISQLRAAASRITATDLQERIPVAARDDVSDLTVTINDMRWTACTRRSPASVGCSMTYDTSSRHRSRFFAATSSCSMCPTSPRSRRPGHSPSMSWTACPGSSMTSRRLRKHSSRNSPSCRSTFVADLTEDVFAKASGIPGHRWKLAEAAHVRVSVDPSRVTQAWLQFVDNAAKYSPAGTDISLGQYDVRRHRRVLGGRQRTRNTRGGP